MTSQNAKTIHQDTRILSREMTHQIGTRFSGSLSELMESGPATGQRPFVDVYSCSLTLSLNILLFFSDTAIVMHSPDGCQSDSFALAYMAAKVRNLELQSPFMHEIRNIHCCSTNFNERNVIFGGEKSLKAAIHETYERYHPRLICVLVSCISAIIGDDVDKVCAEAQAELGEDVYVIPFNTNGFESHAWINYADHVWGGLVQRVMKQPEMVDPDLINFFRPLNMTSADTNEMERLMDLLGLRVNVFPDYQSIDVLEHAAEAALNTGMCKGYHQPVFEAMHKKFQTPYADAPYPLGIRFTEMWLREVGRKTNRSDAVERLIKDEKQRIFPELSRLRNKLRGKTVVVSANHAKTLSFAQACNDLGLTIVSAVTHSTDNSLEKEYQIVKEEAGDIDFHVGSPIYEEMSHLKLEKPDIFVGHLEMGSIAAHLDFPAKNTYFYNFQDAHFGFQGVINLGKQILRGLNNPLKHKILKYYKNETGLNWGSTPFANGAQPFRFASATSSCRRSFRPKCKGSQNCQIMEKIA